MYDNFFQVYEKYKNPMPYNEKYRVLNYLRNLDKVGNMSRGIELKKIEYQKRKKWGPLFVVKKVERYLNEGKDIVESMYLANLINSREKQVFNKAKNFSEAVEQILDLRSMSKKSITGFVLLIFPMAAILLALFFGREAILEVLTNMMKPIVDAGAKPPPIPQYLHNPLIFGLANIGFFSLLAGITIIMQYYKKHQPKNFFKTIPIFEEEYSISIIHSILSMIKSGASLSEAAKILLDGESDPIKTKIYNKIISNTTKGVVNLSDIFESYGINYSTCSLIKMGEDSGRIEEALQSALKEITTRYERDSKIFLQIGLWGGQIGMMMIAMKPMVDIMLLTSVGQMNFEL